MLARGLCAMAQIRLNFVMRSYFYMFFAFYLLKYDQKQRKPHVGAASLHKKAYNAFTVRRLGTGRKILQLVDI